MADLFGIMFDVIAPIFFVIGVAMFVAHRFKPDPRTLSVFVVYVFIPALAFNGIAQSELTGDELGGIAAMAVGIAVLMAIIGLAISRFFKFQRKLESAFLISVILVNAANYGIPLNSFAFGAEGEQRAIIYYVMSVMVGSVMGVYFASRGESSVKEAFFNVLKVPITHAAVLGLLVNVAKIRLPLSLERGIGILADAAVPGMLALLGLQLARTSLKGRWRFILLATGTRLILGPVLAMILAFSLGLTGVTFQVTIVQSSMPTAVLASALATEFKSDAEFTSTVTLLSTILSVMTLSIVLTILTTSK